MKQWSDRDLLTKLLVAKNLDREVQVLLLKRSDVELWNLVEYLVPAEEFYQIEQDEEETVFLYSLKNIPFILNPGGRTCSRLLVSPGLRSELEDIS